jgi:hypothetical protein
MRKIEQDMISALKKKINWQSGDTSVFFADESIGNPHGTRSQIFLHGNHIADYYHNDGSIEVNQRVYKNWPTRTTNSRLYALGATKQELKAILNS